MYGCQQELIICPEKLPIMEYLCATANKLMSSHWLACARPGIYLARQWYFKLGHIAGKYELEKELKRNPNYQFLYSQAAQQTLRGVAESFKSYKELAKKHGSGEIENCPQLPKYRKKGGLAVITYPKQALKLKENKVRVPLGKKVKAAFKIESFSLNFPSNLDFKMIR